jgi:hypothetical protein
MALWPQENGQIANWIMFLIAGDKNKTFILLIGGFIRTLGRYAEWLGDGEK